MGTELTFSHVVRALCCCPTSRYALLPQHIAAETHQDPCTARPAQAVKHGEKEAGETGVTCGWPYCTGSPIPQRTMAFFGRYYVAGGRRRKKEEENQRHTKGKG